jgi:peptidoglycan/xylan/chitin deacetylase (PgdA/CDA1 family)
MRAQVEVLGRVFQFVDLHDLSRPEPSPEGKPWCVITFDDGKKVNCDAAETLRRCGVPACFFVCTDFIGGKVPLWFDDLDALRQADPVAVARFGLEHAKKLPMDTLRARLERAKAELRGGASLSDQTAAPMSWDDVRDLSHAGFSIGAHGRSHAILTNEPFADAETEVRHSLAAVSKQLGKPCRSFAFPNGNYTPQLIQVARDAGAQFVLTTEPVWVGRHWDASKPLPRIQLHSKHNEGQMQLKLLAARSGFLLRDPNGTGREYVARYRHRVH